MPCLHSVLSLFLPVANRCTHQSDLQQQGCMCGRSVENFCRLKIFGIPARRCMHRNLVVESRLSLKTSMVTPGRKAERKENEVWLYISRYYYLDIVLFFIASQKIQYLLLGWIWWGNSSTQFSTPRSRYKRVEYPKASLCQFNSISWCLRIALSNSS